MNILEHLAKQLDEEIDAFKRDLVAGSVEDWATYKYAAGVCRGLMIAKGHIITMDETMMEDEDV